MIFGDRFIGRIEFEKQRKSEPLIVKNIWLEESFNTTKKYELELDNALIKFAKYLGAESYINQNNQGKQVHYES